MEIGYFKRDWAKNFQPPYTPMDPNVKLLSSLGELL